MDQAHPKIAERRGDILDGMREIAPAALAAIPIGLLFGAVAAAKGLSAAEVTLMSVLVFAGGAQFAAVEIWGYPVPIAALAFSTLLVNARHVLMGASLAPKLRMSRRGKFLAFFVLTDEAWALAERRARERPVTGAYWLGVALVLPVAWIVSSALGAALGPLMGDPARLGADFAFSALFIGLVAGFGRGRANLAAIAVSAGVAALVKVTLGAPWHVACGALAGIMAAYLAAPPEETRA